MKETQYDFNSTQKIKAKKELFFDIAPLDSTPIENISCDILKKQSIIYSLSPSL